MNLSMHELRRRAELTSPKIRTARLQNCFASLDRQELEMLLNNKKAVATLHDVGVDVPWQHQFRTSSRR